MAPAFHLAKVFFRMFLRDRRALFFSAMFPLFLMTVLGFARDRGQQPVDIAIADRSGSPAAGEFIEKLGAHPLFNVKTGDETELRNRLLEGEESVVLVIPPAFGKSTNDSPEARELIVLIDAAQGRLVGLFLPVLEQALVGVERAMRGSKAMFTMTVRDVQSRTLRYIDFLLPGILAFSLMQICIAGSGFNIVEYRRKGILKRIFVTPLRPHEFIAGLCLARLAWCVLQLSVLLAIAVLALGVTVAGNYFALYFVIALGAATFLCLGFCVGSLAKTQQAVGAVGAVVIFPQLFLSGVFFPISAMPEAVQPIAGVLPLTFVVAALRAIANDALALVEIGSDLLGIVVWMGICFAAATRLFVWKEVVE